MKLILIRHAETTHNAGGFVQGRADIPLSDLGRRQAAALASSFVGQAIGAIYASPLSRARETADAVGKALGIPVAVEDDLQEMDIGEMEGLSSVEMRERFSAFLHTWAGPEGPTTPMPGGERLIDVQARAWRVIERLRRDHEGETVAVVSHNFVILSLTCQAIGLPLTSFRRLRHGVTGRTTIDFRADRTIILSQNVTCHLDAGGLRSMGIWEGPVLRRARTN